MKASFSDISRQSTIAVASTFTADPLGPSLEFWTRQLGMSARLEFAQFDQVFQQLLDPLSLLARNATGVNVILLRLEDWRPQIERNVMDFVQSMAEVTKRSSAPFVICLCPASSSAASGPDASILQEMQTLLSQELANLAGVHLITPEQLQALYPVAEPHDAQLDRLARIPYTAMFFSALGTMIARKISVLTRPRHKVVVLDCDQTLWSGVCGEGGPAAVRISSENEALQNFMIRQHDAGMLLCLCSKNNEEDVAAVFEYHANANMRLTPDHLVSRKINWRAKSENLNDLATELKLGPDAFIFIDDNPVECAEVRANCPQVLTLQLPHNPGEVSTFLDHVWAFDHLTTTTEGKNRTALYRQNSRREELQRESLTFQDFLAGLDLEVNILPLLPQELARASELTHRSNQFNFTTLRRSEAELQTICQTKTMECLGVRAHDRFGDYGLVGLIIFEAGAQIVRLDTFLLSCRALGKGIEYRMLAKLGEIAQKRSLHNLELRFVPTPKNSPAREFLRELGKTGEAPADMELLLTISAELAATAEYKPTTAAGNAALHAERTNGKAEFDDSSARSNNRLFSYIAEELRSIEKIHQAIVTGPPASPETAENFVAPETPMEQTVATIWSDILGVDKVGIHDSFFNLGGHSLLAMQVLARIGEAFKLELPPSILYLGEFTVAGLSKAILSEQIRQSGSGDLDAILQKLSGLSDDQVRALLNASKDEP